SGPESPRSGALSAPRAPLSPTGRHSPVRTCTRRDLASRANSIMSRVLPTPLSPATSTSPPAPESNLARLLSGAGGLVLVAGESGVGKTRLMMEFAREARSRRVQVLTGECLPVGDSGARGALSAPLRGLSGPLRTIADRCQGATLAEVERLVGSRGKVLAQYEPALVGLAGQDRYPAPADLPVNAARLRLF